jgi:hypothetical protein
LDLTELFKGELIDEAIKFGGERRRRGGGGGGLFIEIAEKIVNSDAKIVGD